MPDEIHSPNTVHSKKVVKWGTPKKLIIYIYFICLKKAAHKMLVILTTGVNFINILLAPRKCYVQLFSSYSLAL